LIEDSDHLTKPRFGYLLEPCGTNYLPTDKHVFGIWSYQMPSVTTLISLRRGTLRAWEHTFSSVLHFFRLDSIKAKILLLSILATLIPTLSMGWISYRMITQYLDQEVAQELRNATSHTARELDLWLKERRYELRVFASSYEVSENADTMLRTRASASSKDEARRRLKGYLQSVRGKFPDYEEILVISRSGTALVSTAEQPGDVHLPASWQKRTETDTPVVGDAFPDKALKARVVTVPVAIRSTEGKLLGFLVAKPNLRLVVDALKRTPLSTSGQVYLVRLDGTIVGSSRWSFKEVKEETLPVSTVQSLSELSGKLMSYENTEGTEVLGALQWLTHLDWGVVAEIGMQEAYSKAMQLRKITILILLNLLLGMGLVSYVLGQAIVRPLHRLTKAAAGVAGGNFTEKVPVVGYGEIAYLTEVFNDMVQRLSQAQEQLASTNRLLSVHNQALESVALSDSLTGLFNRKYMMEKLADEMARSLRNERPFSILMLDLDYFKRYNDTYGHLAGDLLLKKAAEIFKESIREVDVAARYGGEEFIVILTEVNEQGALEPAERIRHRVATELSADGLAEVTISIGVAEFPARGETPMELIASADTALYQAKRLGRNRVVLAGSDTLTEQSVEHQPGH
jgi:diguanylate cyclase (GGDEF)-like protein